MEHGLRPSYNFTTVHLQIIGYACWNGSIELLRQRTMNIIYPFNIVIPYVSIRERPVPV